MSVPKTISGQTTILYVHPSDELYGSDRVLLQLVSGLDRTQFEPIVVLPSDIPYEGKLSAALDQYQIKHYSIRMGVLRRRYLTPFGFLIYLYNLFYGIWRLNQLVSVHDVRLIHSNTSTVLGGAIVARLHGIKHVWHIHEILKKPKWFGRIMCFFIRTFSHRIIAVSRAVADPITIPKHQSKIGIVWNGIDTKEFSIAVDGQSLRKHWGVKKNTVVIGIIGRISHWKGQELFLKAAARATRKCKNTYFILVGDPVPGEEFRLAHLHRLIIDLNIAKQTRIIPFTDNISQIMRALDILVLPSTLPEALGLVILEAMACTRCVIAAAHGGPWEAIEPAETGLLVPPNNVEALAAAMIELANDPERRYAMGQKGRQRVVELFSLANFRKKIIRIYDEILEEGKQHQRP